MRAVQVTIRGRVQGVGFRWSTRTKARELGLAGWVRNTPDGAVEALFVGEGDAVEAMLAWCQEGPSAARVTRAEHQEADTEAADKLEAFDIR